MVSATITVTTESARTGVPVFSLTTPRAGVPSPSRLSAYRMRVAPTTHAITQPKALIAVPSVMMSPIDEVT